MQREQRGGVVLPIAVAAELRQERFEERAGLAHRALLQQSASLEEPVVRAILRRGSEAQRRQQRGEQGRAAQGSASDGGTRRTAPPAAWPTRPLTRTGRSE